MRYCFILLFVVVGEFAGAQYNYLAYQVSGTVTFSDKKKEYPLKVGKILDETKAVSVGKNSSLTLVCEKSAQTVVLKEGAYALGKLAAQCDKDEHSMTSNYFNYVWWQFTHPKATADEERKRNMTGPGAVSRGCVGVDFFTPDTISFYQENIILRWKTTAAKVSREFAFYAFDNSPVPLVKIPVKKDHFSLDSLGMKLEPGTDYFWTVLINDEEVCERKLIQVWSKEDFDELLNNINSALTLELDPAEKNYLFGYLMEKNGLTGEAYRYYKLAAEARPGNHRYKTTLKRFRELFAFNKK